MSYKFLELLAKRARVLSTPFLIFLITLAFKFHCLSDGEELALGCTVEYKIAVKKFSLWSLYSVSTVGRICKEFDGEKNWRKYL